MASVLEERPGVRQGITDEDWKASNISTVSTQQGALVEWQTATQRIVSPFLDGQLILETEGSLPAWFTRTMQALDRLGSLQDDWDSYGAPRISRTSIFAALDLLLPVMGDKTPAPAVVPTNRGTVLLEWHTRGVDLEIEVVSSQRLDVAFEDADHAIEWEREIGSDLAPLIACLQRLSETD
jgi:hypothetical protein